LIVDRQNRLKQGAKGRPYVPRWMNRGQAL
jgi:hypothetical protein